MAPAGPRSTQPKPAEVGEEDLNSTTPAEPYSVHESHACTGR
jgi:hypothetical protein